MKPIGGFFWAGWRLDWRLIGPANTLKSPIMEQSQIPPLPMFGTRLKRMPQAMGIKQLTLAMDLGVDQATISRWELGRQMPDIAFQQCVFRHLSRHRSDDATLRGLVESSRDQKGLNIR